MSSEIGGTSLKMEIDIQKEEISDEIVNTDTSPTDKDHSESFDCKDEETGSKVKSESTEKNSAAAGTEESDPYGYLQRDEFSSERFKIEVKGLPKFYGFGEMKKLLNNRLHLNAHKMKPLKNGFMFVNFRSEEERKKAVDVLNGYKWKNRVLGAVFAKAAGDPMVRKRAHEEIEKGTSGFSDTNESIEESVKRVTTPWWNIPYPEQLQKKMDAYKSIVIELTKQILIINPSFKLEDGKQICDVEEIKPSPVTEEYRNKCGFTIGYNPTTSEKMVGFRISSYKEGSVAIGPVNDLIHLPNQMLKGALAFQKFIRSSEFDPFNAETHAGCWKQLTVRTTCDGQLMLMILINQQHLKPEETIKLKATLKSAFESLEDPKINSFYLKVMESSGQQHKNFPELLFGEECITETVLGLQFRISPEAFFQINIKATEVLYSTVGSLLESNPETTVLDVCCGTGTIGLCMANKCGQVLGIEMVQSAVNDAKRNAELNGLSDKCEFFAGKAEDIIDAVLLKAKFKNITAIVDPPRAGLHQKVLLLLRKCEKIKTLIYVSCDAKAATRNFVDLTRPISNTYKGAPFFPKKIIPVDLFPHTHHSELVLLFERLEKPQEQQSNDTT